VSQPLNILSVLKISLEG